MFLSSLLLLWCAHCCRQGGPVYELFAVLVHQGSADFGHYYAFIKNFVDGQWYKFNDENVQRVAEKHVVTERYSQMPGSPMRRGAYGVPVSSSAALGVRVPHCCCCFPSILFV